MRIHSKPQYAAPQVITADGETEDADALNNAATKVQAGWRGHQARKSIAKMKEEDA
jgi:hypothetical protein